MHDNNSEPLKNTVAHKEFTVLWHLTPCFVCSAMQEAKNYY